MPLSWKLLGIEGRVGEGDREFMRRSKDAILDYGKCKTLHVAA